MIIARETLTCGVCGMTGNVEELLYRLRSRLLATINIARTRSVSIGANGDFENRHQIFYFFTYRPEILHTPRGRQHAKSCRGEFRISSPEKFGAPLNFAFALRLMGRKISNRYFEVVFKHIGLTF